jgi:hypothetical protein
LCDFCKVRCNTCVHKDEKEDISDTWEDDYPILVDWCNGEDSNNICVDYETKWKFCPICGRNLNQPKAETIRDNTFAVKDRDGFYFIGYNKWDKQIRKAKLYHSYKYAKETCDDIRFIERDTYIVRVDICEIGECEYD